MPIAQTPALLDKEKPPAELHSKGWQASYWQNLNRRAVAPALNSGVHATFISQWVGLFSKRLTTALEVT